MYAEAWRLQKDHFWVENMSGVDWEKVYNRYFPLIERVGSRSEFSDLMWEMQGELGTSHAYEMGGDYRPCPSYNIGFLGANIKFDSKQSVYIIEKIIRGDTWDLGNQSPFLRPGIQAEVGMIIRDINGNKMAFPKEGKYVKGATMIYVCENKVCQLPTTEIKQALKQIR